VLAGTADPLLHAAGVAIAPVAASGIAAAIAAGRTVGSVVIALMIAVLAYLGGVVAAFRFGDRELAPTVCMPVLLGGAVAAFSTVFSAVAPLLVISMSALWAYRVGLVGARDRLGLTGQDRYSKALVCTLLAGGPAVTRAVLYML
jgi:hypothetical protein